MPARKSSGSRRDRGAPGPDAYLDSLKYSEPFAQLDTKIVRARAQDQPVLYADALPGLDLLLCAVRGAHPPYPKVAELRYLCIEFIADALEQPIDQFDNGGYWYEANGFGCLVFASRARARVLADFGAPA